MLFSFLGSLIFLQFTLMETVFKTPEITAQSTTESNAVMQYMIEVVLSDYSILQIAFVIGIPYALIFAFAIAAGYSKHGCVRYFISGVILPAFTLFVARSVSTIYTLFVARSVSTI